MLVSQMIEHTSLKHANLMKKITTPLLQHFGVHYFCYQFVSHDGNWFTLGNHPEWLCYSAEHAFYRHDPSLVCANRYVESAYLVRAHSYAPFQQTIIHHAVEKFEIDHCLMLIKPTLDGCEHYFFAAPRQHVHVMQAYISQFSRLNRDYVDYVQMQIKPIYDQLMAQAVDLKRINLEQFYSTQNVLNIHENCQAGRLFQQHLKPTPILTFRESQCLAYYRQGLTAKQTAKQLGLSFRTIEGYFENIKLKYEIQFKQELLFLP